MGPQRDSGGALTEAIQQLRATSVPHRRITLVSVGADTVVRAETNPSELNDALSRITSEPIPGGIDRAAGPDGLSVIRPLVDDQTDLVLVSTFAKTPEPHSHRSKRSRSLQRAVAGRATWPERHRWRYRLQR